MRKWASRVQCFVRTRVAAQMPLLSGRWNKPARSESYLGGSSARLVC